MSTPDPKHFLLVGNASYANRGCEAIVRGTMEILRREFGDDITASAGIYGDPAEIRAQGDTEVDATVSNFALLPGARRWTRAWVEEQFNRRLGTRFAGVQAPLLPHLAGRCSALEIGGDNFSLDYGVPGHFLTMDRFLKERGLPVILWGASVGPFDAEPEFAEEMFAHLRSLRAVFVRESLSREYLAGNGVTNNVHLMSDPGFVMPPSEPDPDALGFTVPDGAIGLNFSPLMAKFLIEADLPVWELKEEHLEAWTSLCIQAVEALASETRRDIVLIPHVGSTFPGIDDFRFLARVARRVKPSSKTRILSVPEGLDARELKAVIARCHVFAGARTHSTIAAISSAVPTLSLGYSLKAKGLNEDIFGKQDYCLDTASLTLEGFLERMMLLLDERDEVAAFLEDRLPSIKEGAFAAGKKLREVLEA